MVHVFEKLILKYEKYIICLPCISVFNNIVIDALPRVIFVCAEIRVVKDNLKFLTGHPA